MCYMPDNTEIHLYVNDLGVVSCHMGCDDWVPAYDLRTRRTNLADLVDTIRQHVALTHTHDSTEATDADR